MKIYRRLARLSVLYLVWSLLVPAVASASDTEVRRFGLIVGANHGGRERAPLRYAGSDARAVAAVLEELGGLTADDRLMLLEPTRASLEEAVSRLRKRMAERGKAGQRVEMLLYYSGHSDEDGLLLGEERVTYPELRQMLERLPADVRIAILDSCASGALLRTKGGRRRPPFLTDGSTRVQGHAYLTSSAEDEAAQESDRIKGSYFTQSLVSGLRGAADVTRDGRVTLNEAYQFAFHETLARTERTSSGPQHPTFDIRLVGSGDLVLTDLRGTSAGMVLTDTLAGTLYIRDREGRLIASMRKSGGQPIELGFEPGEYRIMLVNGATRLEAVVTLTGGQRLPLTLSQFRPVALERTARRGEAEIDANSESGESVGTAGALEDGDLVGDGEVALAADWRSESDVPVPSTSSSPRRFVPFVLSVFPPLSTHPMGMPDESVGISLGVLASRHTSISGFAAATVGTWVDEDVTGVQLGGVGNVTRGVVRGLQGAGAINGAGGVDRAVQAAGTLNVATGPVRGAQLAGAVNIAGGGVQGGQAAGAANFVLGAMNGVQLAGALNVTTGGMLGLQGAGAANLARGGFTGAQASGGLNVALGPVTGAQLSGVLNVAGDMRGVQISTVNVSGGKVGAQIGVVNIAGGPVRGPQIGIVNIAEDGVAPIGLLSIVKKGYHSVGVWGDELKAVHVGVKTGGRVLYNHWAVGVREADGGETELLASLALGAHMRRGPVFADLELMSSNAMKVGEWWPDGVLGSLRLSVGYQLFPFLAVSGGPSVNVLVTQDGDRFDPGVSTHLLYSGPEATVRLWPGFNLGVQL